jgi:glycosyltransferase involved in cell wall biosynthesis
MYQTLEVASPPSELVVEGIVAKRLEPPCGSVRFLHSFPRIGKADSEETDLPSDQTLEVASPPSELVVKKLLCTEAPFQKTYNQHTEIVYSIIIPVYNQEEYIVENLKSIISNTLGTFEIIIILDFCFDNTEKNIFVFLENYHSPPDNFAVIQIFKNEDKPLFETKCDNIGFKNSKGKYCLEIQADMKMTCLGYNIELTKPFILLDNVIAVSGRCAHNLYNSNSIGKTGYNIEKTVDQLNIQKNKFYVFDTCNRGPLLLEKSKLSEMNYLDEDNYFLDDSDHDLMARSYIEKGYICGYVPIDFYAPLFLGSTRNNNTYNFCKEYLINQNEKQRLLNKPKNGLEKYKNIWKSREPVVYDLTVLG